MKSLLESSCLIYLLLFTNTLPSYASNANRKNVFALRGKKVKLSATVDHNQSRYFLWYKDGQAISWNRHDRSNVLLIEHVDFRDNGVYEYRPLYGKDNGRPYTINLEVLSTPFFTLEPKNVTTVEGKTVEFKCEAGGAPKPAVTWMGMDQKLIEGRYEIVDHGKLQIRDVSVFDAGEYTCLATNEYGVVNATVRVEVKEDTKITDAPDDLEIVAGNTAKFRCNAQADLTLRLRISWLRNNQSIDIDEEPRINLHNNTLMIIKTNSLDSGTYTCVASTDLDEVRAQAILVVHGEPNPPTLHSVTCGSNEAYVLWAPANDSWSPILRFSVEYNTSFTPEIWDTIEDDVPASDQSCEVKLSPWVNYTFRVITWNEHGPSESSSHSSVCTTLPDVPYKNPENVEAKGDDPQSLTIKWTVMPQIEHNGPKFMYRVYYKRDIPGEKWTIEDIHDWQKNQLKVDNQSSYQRYKIKVGDVNERGECRQPPQEIVGYSGEGVPLQAPGNFTFEMTSDTSALLSWDRVPEETVRGKLRGYIIEYTTDKNGYSSTIITIEPNETQASIDGLTPHRKYYVSIRAFNGRYHGFTSEIIIET